MRMRKKKWVKPFLEKEELYLISDLNDFNTDKPIYIEIGMGMGDFITQSAKLNPDIFYVGLEKEETCVARSIKKAIDLNLDNFKVIHLDAINIKDIIPDNKIDLIYLHFSDPWPKKRNHKRRLTYMPYLKMYEDILKDKGVLVFKTDNELFFDDSILYFEQSNFINLQLDRNYYKENEPMTAYQEKFVLEGKPIYYAKYIINKV